jgi:hypothetical protein
MGGRQSFDSLIIGNFEEPSKVRRGCFAVFYVVHEYLFEKGVLEFKLTERYNIFVASINETRGLRRS